MILYVCYSFKSYFSNLPISRSRPTPFPNCFLTEVIQSHTFLGCEYATFMKVMFHNKGRQSEANLFKGASKWILADGYGQRVDLSEEIFRLLGISQVTYILQEHEHENNYTSCWA